MVTLPGLHVAYIVAFDLVLPPNQTDTRGARNVGLNICWNARGAGHSNSTRANDSGDVGEFATFSFLGPLWPQRNSSPRLD